MALSAGLAACAISGGWGADTKGLHFRLALERWPEPSGRIAICLRQLLDHPLQFLDGLSLRRDRAAQLADLLLGCNRRVMRQSCRQVPCLGHGRANPALGKRTKARQTLSSSAHVFPLPDILQDGPALEAWRHASHAQPCRPGRQTEDLQSCC